MALVERALLSRRFGPYTLQAAIAAVHSEAATVAATDWPQIVALYSVLARAEPSPVIELNRAVAVAMCDGPQASLALIDALLARGELAQYHLAHSTRGRRCPQQQPGRGGASFLRKGPGVDPAGAGAALPRKPASGVGLKKSLRGCRISKTPRD